MKFYEADGDTFLSLELRKTNNKYIYTYKVRLGSYTELENKLLLFLDKGTDFYYTAPKGFRDELLFKHKPNKKFIITLKRNVISNKFISSVSKDMTLYSLRRAMQKFSREGGGV